MSLVEIARRLAREVDALSFGPPVAFVYNPLGYAWEAHARYLERFGRGPKEAVLVGMNPGPFGMAQTGVPFGEVAAVRDWMGIEAAIGHPPKEHPKRPVQGFACPRSEVSGARLWGWAKERYGRPEAFFSRFFVLNYCPLVFLEESGRNRTPDKLSAIEREALTLVCDRALRESLEVLAPKHVVGVGAWACGSARRCVRDGLEVGQILHPSPASPKANRGWAHQAEAELAALGVAL
jgi:single-strand selective monofunctional uracil DNA glycosylase